jgi:hypothetical protein
MHSNTKKKKKKKRCINLFSCSYEFLWIIMMNVYLFHTPPWLQFSFNRRRRGLNLQRELTRRVLCELFSLETGIHEIFLKKINIFLIFLNYYFNIFFKKIIKKKNCYINPKHPLNINYNNKSWVCRTAAG